VAFPFPLLLFLFQDAVGNTLLGGQWDFVGRRGLGQFRLQLRIEELLGP